jgi:hypothetical protein
VFTRAFKYMYVYIRAHVHYMRARAPEHR